MSKSLFGIRGRSLNVAAAFVAVALTARMASAVVHIYDPFGFGGGPGDYLAGDDSIGLNVIGGQSPVASPNPGFYAGGWIQSGGDAQAVRIPGTPAGFSVLNYPNFPRTGGIVTDAVQFNCCSFGRDGREIAGGLGGGRSGPRTIYQSFLVDFGNQGTDDPTQFGKRGVEWWNGGIGDSFLAVDLFVNHFSGTTDFTLAVITPSGAQSALLNGGGLTLANMSGVHLVVMKFEFNPADLVDPLVTAADDDRVTVYLDPTDSIESNWTPAASIAVNASDLFISHHGLTANFTFSGGGHKPARFDELRWGDTFADVTPFVPEPASLTLLGLSAAGLLLGRRWRDAPTNAVAPSRAAGSIAPFKRAAGLSPRSEKQLTKLNRENPAWA